MFSQETLELHSETNDPKAWTVLKTGLDSCRTEYRLDPAGSGFRIYRFSTLVKDISATEAVHACWESVGTPDCFCYGDRNASYILINCYRNSVLVCRLHF